MHAVPRCPATVYAVLLWLYLLSAFGKLNAYIQHLRWSTCRCEKTEKSAQFRVWDKGLEGNTLTLEFPDNTVWDKPRVTSIPKKQLDLLSSLFWLLGSLVVRVLDLRLNGREFDPRPPHYRSVGTGMGDRLRPRYVTSHPGQLSLLPFVEREMSTDQSAVMLSGWEVKAGWLIPFVDKRVGGG